MSPIQKSTAAWLVLTISVLTACGSQPAATVSDDPVDLAIERSLLTAQIGCAGDGWDAATSTLTLTVDTETLVLSAPGGRIDVNGVVCTGMIRMVETQLTTKVLRSLIINGTDADDVVILDLAPGPFGTSITGGITVNMGTAASVDKFQVRGSANKENVKIGDLTSGELVIELNGDRTAEVKVTADDYAMLATTFSLGDGPDIINAAPKLGDITKFGSTTVALAPPLSSKLVAYGGPGDDILTGGGGDDELYGGPGNDTFKMAAAADGADRYEGDTGIDSVDYSGRTDGVTVDIGHAAPNVTGTIDLTELDFAGGALDGETLALRDSGQNVTVVFDAPDSPEAVASQINAVRSKLATLTGQNFLSLTTTSTAANASMDVLGSGSAYSRLGLASGSVTSLDDADDGADGENDDVRSTVENVTGGSGDDVLIGSSERNVLKGGRGDDVLEGGANTACSSSGDALSGEDGDDGFVVPAVNCRVVINGGAGVDTVDYSARGSAVRIDNLKGTADDGNATANERGTVGEDIEILVGGFGNDSITGGVGNDKLRGGPGDDILSGGAGDDVLFGEAGDDVINGGQNGALGDRVDYSEVDAGQLGSETLAGVTVSLCFDDTAPTGNKSSRNSTCGAGDDGVRVTASGPDVQFEHDQLLNVEIVTGTDGDDVMSLSSAEITAQAALMVTRRAAVTFVGGLGNDQLTGGPGSDTLWGDEGDDVLKGLGGDDFLAGGEGADDLDGGNDGGDICIADGDDSVSRGCEL